MIHIIGYSPTGLYVLQMVTCGGVNWLVLCWFCYGVGRHAATVVLWDIDYGQLLVLMGSAKTASVVRNKCKHCWPMLPTGFEKLS
ncbi:hypothetical protein MtrunA17_Chr3g0085441 [Medicago truncatula]|uniref:Transmembrane protein n=1 Tax=Medicago truncatula TaxID=3880 RepID=A0A396INM3_MEDTR|nr:hypothetical protein MtrunA17_Chr3g0085441 [Medicago truncatula]